MHHFGVSKNKELTLVCVILLASIGDSFMLGVDSRCISLEVVILGISDLSCFTAKRERAVYQQGKCCI